jgi:endonuclease/exonuclease/phosphatase family metal-dependent hydrolase
MHFNVENLFLFLDLYNGQDFKKITEAEWKKLSSSTTQNKPLRKVWQLAQIIRDTEPDIIMFNEVGGQESLENFNKHFLNSDYKVFLKEGNSNRGIDVGYLIRANLDFKAVLITHKDRPLNFLYPHQSATPAGGKSHYFSRDVAELRLFHSTENTPRLVILLTHLKSKLNPDNIDPEGKLRRAAELKTLVEIYNEVRKELGPQVPVVVTGDMNGIASKTNMEPEFAPIYDKTDLQELLELCEKPQEERYTQVQITPLGKQNFLQIDYIFVSPDLAEQVEKSQSGVHHFKNELGHKAPPPRNLEERNLLASDHYPTILTLKMK